MVRKPRRNPVTDEEILASYQATHSGQKTAKALDIGLATVDRVLRKNDIPRPGLKEWRDQATKFRGQEAAIRQAYETGLTYLQLREMFGEASNYAYKHALRRAGATLRENPAPLIQPGELERIRDLNASGMGQVSISLALGRSQSFISRVMRKNGIRTILAKGEKHPMWKGGRVIDSNGYVRAWVADDDPLIESMRLNDGYVLEHRLNMARKLNRPLRRSETVHHIDGDKGNNDPSNLQLRQGKHGKGLVMCCLDCGSRNIGHVKLGH